MNEKLQFIREKCIAANPEIVLRLGEANGISLVKHPPIRLADVLLAIEEHFATDSSMKINDIQSEIVSHTYLNGKYIRPPYWNLRADDLEKQSRECLAFLYNLLT
jgi:hypothetical protein